MAADEHPHGDTPATPTAGSATAPPLEHPRDASHPRAHVHGGRTAVLAVGALGVVYGDIGTNPLFAMREAFEGNYHVALNEENVLGLLSLMFWSLILVITIKYLTFVMRADNDGEGGILALAALINPTDPAAKGRRWLLLLLGLFGAALLYGDGVITPAISVLAAVEGTEVATPSMQPYVIPLAVVIIVVLFAVQRKGTGTIGKIFGPVMICWFLTIGVLGATQVLQNPSVFKAINPRYAVSYFADNGFMGFLVLGAVILVVVGGEALYADMGHFGRRPITIGWYALVLPSLLLVYFGQGALLIREPEAVENPFFHMAPDWALLPLVVLATLATVIASQALISGAFSLTRQAIQLGFSPRLHVRHTSAQERGQIYLSTINWFLMVACIGLILGFRSSTSLAAAYGLAVTTTMVITSIIFFVVARERFGWARSKAVPLCALFLVVDGAFFGATLFKIPEGGWFPLLMALVIFTVLSTWRTGRRLVLERVLKGGVPVEQFIETLDVHPEVRAPGSGAYLFRMPGVTPPALLTNLRHNDSLHEEVLLISVVTEEVPYVHKLRRAEVKHLGSGFHEVIIHYGFMDDMDIPLALRERVIMKTGTDLDTLTYFLGRESFRITDRPGMAVWREQLFVFMAKNATSVATYYELPTEQTVEIGLSLEF